MKYNLLLYLLVSVPEQFVIVYFVTKRQNKWNRLIKEDKQILVGLTFIFCLFYFPLSNLDIHLQLLLITPFILNTIMLTNLLHSYYDVEVLKTVRSIVHIYAVKALFIMVSITTIIIFDKGFTTLNILGISWLVYFPLLVTYVYYIRFHR
jgi:hypothetical protein